MDAIQEEAEDLGPKRIDREKINKFGESSGNET